MGTHTSWSVRLFLLPTETQSNFIMLMFSSLGLFKWAYTTFDPPGAVFSLFLNPFTQASISCRMMVITDPAAVQEPVLSFYWFDHRLPRTDEIYERFEPTSYLSSWTKQTNKINVAAQHGGRRAVAVGEVDDAPLHDVAHSRIGPGQKWAEMRLKCVWIRFVKYCSHPGPPSTPHSSTHAVM